MSQIKLLITSLITIILIAVLHQTALAEHWYFTHRWIDIVIHIMGGFWIAITALWLLSSFIPVQSKTQTLTMIFVSVLVVGTIWEFFELASGNTFIHTSNFWIDSISDMINNCIGGALVAIYAILKLTYKK